MGRHHQHTTVPTDETPKDMTFTGTYKMASTFDIATNMPGKAGQISNMFIAATDDADDPTNWLLEQMINAMPNGTAKTLLDNARGFVSGYLNDRLLQWAPDFVSTMVEMGNNFGDLTHHFGLVETMSIAGADGVYSASHQVTGVHLKLDTNEADFMFSDMGTPVVSVDGIGVDVGSNGKLTFANHTLPLQYGAIMRVGLDGMIIPAIDANAANLGDLFAHQIDCAAVSQYVADAIGFGGSTTYAGACAAGLNAGANYLYSQLADVDGSALEFAITGSGRALDSNGDKAADKIQTGTWTGDLSYAGSPAPLGAATFHAERQ
ncbi:MAG: hypothetical protein NT062_07575 [Proteobacteria bacterium]|nr:hypothetical protein [Pseudomonadota bacterium]